MTKRFYKVREVADILGITTRSLYNWERAGKIPKPRRDPMSNYRLYTKEDLQKLKKITGRPL